MANNIKSNTSFWAEISDYKIQVPYYQRDYAQGRKDGEYNKDNYVKGRIDNIREVFVEELYEARNNNGKCHLGLVFGSYDEDDKIFIAVDGQQRLTTVFLLHWYVAWRENKLNDYKVLSTNFSWDTRSYSSQFVKLLFKIERSDDVIYAITTNPDYFSVWENDPTVKGMLIMLKEIEEQYPEGEYDLCSKLFLNDCNIRYDILKLKKNSDEKTYLKMNSRGRSLTTFELFKSKFLDKYQPDFGHKIDNEWLNFMLKKIATSDGQFSDPDIPFMNFINEYTYLQLKLNCDQDNSIGYKEFTDAKLKGELTDMPFISFDKYNCAFEGDRLKYFEKSLEWICRNYEIIKQIDDEVRFCDSRFFIDAIIRENNPNFSHRTKLYAALKYAELTGYAPIDTELYKKWTRVFRNLVANTDIDGSNIGGICKAINKIDDSNICRYLSNGGVLTAFTKDQIVEEIAKAKQILNGTSREDGKSWEKIITEAEKYAFFKGAIRFLFTKEQIGDDWHHFDTKWKNTIVYFDDKGVRDGKDLNKKYKTNSLIMKSLLANCDDFWGKVWWHFEFANDSTHCKSILISDKWRNAVDVVMNAEITLEKTAEYVKKVNDEYIKNIIDDGLMDYICDKMPKSWIRGTYHGYHAIWQSGYPSSQIVLNPILAQLSFDGTIDYSEDNRIKNCRYYRCVDKNVDFKYKNNYFRWYGYPNDEELDVYLMGKDEKGDLDYWPRNHELPEETTENKNWFCFRVDENTTPDSFTEMLDCLIHQAEADEQNQPCYDDCQNKINGCLYENTEHRF